MESWGRMEDLGDFSYFSPSFSLGKLYEGGNLFHFMFYYIPSA